MEEQGGGRGRGGTHVTYTLGSLCLWAFQLEIKTPFPGYVLGHTLFPGLELMTEVTVGRCQPLWASWGWGREEFPKSRSPWRFCCQGRRPAPPSLEETTLDPVLGGRVLSDRPTGARGSPPTSPGCPQSGWLPHVPYSPRGRLRCKMASGRSSWSLPLAGGPECALSRGD